MTKREGQAVLRRVLEGLPVSIDELRAIRLVLEVSAQRIANAQEVLAIKGEVPAGHGWTHAICDKCWGEQAPGRVPVRVVGKVDVCCFCGGKTNGIYIRKNPDSKELCCGGVRAKEAK